MLSEKLTLSLTFLVVLLAFGLAAYTPSVMADGATHDFKVTISAAETMIDVVYPANEANHIQIASGRDRASRALTADTAREATLITLLIETQEIVNLGDPDFGATDPDLTGRSGADIDAAAINEAAAAVLDDTDINIDAYDMDGRSLGILPLDEVANVVVLAHRDGTNPGREFLVRVDETKLTDAYDAIRGGGAAFEIHTLLFSIDKGEMQQADIAHVTAVRGGHDDGVFHVNGRSNVFRVDLVDDDEGLAAYNLGVGATAAGAGVPGVVAIQTLRERAGFIETGAFQVRVILTEEPMGGLTTDLISVTDEDGASAGEATAVDMGATLNGASTTPAQTNELTVNMVSYTLMDGTDAAAATLPQATGRDNKYHQYFVTIQPNPGLNEDITISINQFSDQVIPVANQYVPLAYTEIVATTLTTNQTNVRNARVSNESLTVTVSTAAAAAKFTDAEKLVNPNEKLIPHNIGDDADGTLIPAGGYLVVTNGDADGGVIASPDKTADKKTDAQKAYEFKKNLGFPHPAANLDTFFRNGGTIQVLHRDIAANENDGALAAGSIIVNEIMWATDEKGGAAGQWIELKNTTAANIKVEENELRLAFSVGTPAATTDTVLDAAGNGGAVYFEMPGEDSVALSQVGDVTTSSVAVSASRVMGTAAAGTMESSWAESIRPSLNLNNNNVGTPGADNNHMPVVMDEPMDDAMDEPTATPATAPDIMVSEVMYDSGGGRRSQWIELANVTNPTDLDLTGWSLMINNDPDDADVAGGSITIPLGDLMIPSGQVALVVSQTSAVNSGVDMAGEARTDGDANTGKFDADRIIDADAHPLLSEMAFKVSLMPPQEGNVVEYGDVVGNLGEGWELPMAEEGRSSLIRRSGADASGTDAAGWVLASETNLDGAYRTTYYGDDDDIGTPGYNAGGALPVELSMFYAKRDPVSGQVQITWETQSELNNAGFFIKRSNQQKGNFVVVNPVMIPGAGTTAEKQSYTYTDHSAKPGVVYYYQIEDVSLDGNRQTLNRASRLKGHIGAAGKATTVWGELKSQE